MKTNKQRIITVITGLSLIAVIALVGCKKNDSAPGSNEVWMQNTAFVPSTINVSANTTVTWTNKDGMDHNVTSDAGAFTSPTIHSGGTYSFKFTTAGTYTYHCTFHAGMNGTVVVH